MAKGLCEPCYRKSRYHLEKPVLYAYRRRKGWANNLRVRYGITQEFYEQMLKDQGGVCWICQEPPKEKRLHVDHDHQTGKVRALLCFLCNQALGNLRDKPEIALKAADYLWKFRG